MAGTCVGSRQNPLLPSPHDAKKERWTFRAKLCPSQAVKITALLIQPGFEHHGQQPEHGPTRMPDGLSQCGEHTRRKELPHLQRVPSFCRVPQRVVLVWLPKRSFLATQKHDAIFVISTFMLSQLLCGTSHNLRHSVVSPQEDSHLSSRMSRHLDTPPLCSQCRRTHKHHASGSKHSRCPQVFSMEIVPGCSG